MVQDHARAEDITQDVFMSALRRMRDTDRPIAFRPWVYEIAKNACIDQFRRSRRAEEVSMDAEEGLGSADYGKLVTKDAGPEAAVENKQSLDHLCGAFGGLSETHHEILVMRELKGLSYRDIGERMGMTRPAVESTLFRARRRLTEEYEELVTGERCQRVQDIIALAADRSIGARDRNRLARHVSHCQPCLRHARTAGLDGSDLVHRPLRQKVAALLPLPAFLRGWSAQAGAVDPGVVSGWSKAAAAAATIALAGVGAGVATDQRSGAVAPSDAPGIVESLGGGEDAAPVPSGRTGAGSSASGGAPGPVAVGRASERPPATDRRGAASASSGSVPGPAGVASESPAPAPAPAADAVRDAPRAVGAGAPVRTPDARTPVTGADVRDMPVPKAPAPTPPPAEPPTGASPPVPAPVGEAVERTGQVVQDAVSTAPGILPGQ